MMKTLTPELLHESFEAFAELFFMEDGHYITPSQRALCKHLQYGPNNLQVSCFRNFGKSLIVEALCAWTLYNDPQKRVLVISAASDRAKNFTLSLQNRFQTIPWLQHLATQPGQRSKSTEFDVGPAKTTQVPSVKALGIEARKNGNRADLLVFDDVEVPELAMTDQAREKLMDQIKEGTSILLPLPTSRQIFLGTPSTQFSIYDKLADAFPKYVWPVRYPDPEKMSDTYMDSLATELLDALDEDPTLIGKPTDDVRFNEEVIQAKFKEVGATYFTLQYQLDTTLSDVEKFPLKFQDCLVFSMDTQLPENLVWSNDKANRLVDLPAVGLSGDAWYSPARVGPDYGDPDEVIVSIDSATTGQDETCAVVVAQKNGYFFVLDILAFLESAARPDKVTEVLRLAHRYNASTILVETNHGGDMMIHHYQREAASMGYAVGLEGVRATGRKESRIIGALERVMAGHKLCIDPKVIEYDFSSNATLRSSKRMEYMLGYQLSRICDESGALKHDDRIDALAQAVMWFKPALDISADVEAAARKKQELDAFHKLMDYDHLTADALAHGMSFTRMLEIAQQSRGADVYDWT